LPRAREACFETMGDRMSGITPSRLVGDEPAAGDERERYDILILDGGSKQAVTSARSLGRAGLRVAVA